jgi:hypothetical protein
MVGSLGSVLEDGEQRVANSTQNHNGGSQSGVVNDPRVRVLFECDIEDLMRSLDGTMPSDDSEPLLSRQPVGRQTG